MLVGDGRHSIPVVAHGLEAPDLARLGAAKVLSAKLRYAGPIRTAGDGRLCFPRVRTLSCLLTDKAAHHRS